MVTRQPLSPALMHHSKKIKNFPFILQPQRPGLKGLGFRSTGSWSSWFLESRGLKSWFWKLGSRMPSPRAGGRDSVRHRKPNQARHLFGLGHHRDARDGPGQPRGWDLSCLPRLARYQYTGVSAWSRVTSKAHSKTLELAIGTTYKKTWCSDRVNRSNTCSG